MSSMVIGHGFPQLETSKYILKMLSEWFVSCSLKVFLDTSDAEINETISKCGINQEIIQKSCGDRKVETSKLYGIAYTYWSEKVESCWYRFLFAGWSRKLKWNNLTKIFHIFRWLRKRSDLSKKTEDKFCSFQ